MDINQLREFVSLKNQEADLDDQLKAIKARLDELEVALIPQFIADGVDATSLDGRTIGIVRDVFASPRDGDRQAVIDGFKEADLAQYVQENFNSASVSKWVREIARDVEKACQIEDRFYDEAAIERALPGAMGRVLKVAFVFKLSSRKKR